MKAYIYMLSMDCVATTGFNQIALMQMALAGLNILTTGQSTTYPQKNTPVTGYT